MGEIEKRIWGLLRANPFLVLGGVILSLLLVFFWWKLPRWLLAPSKDLLEPADFLRLENDIRTSFTQAIGVIALFIGIPVAWFNLRAQKENQRHQLRLAALDKRLTVHQKAYML